MLKLLLSLLLTGCFAEAVIGQQMNIDSLTKALATAKEDTNKVNILANLSRAVKFTDLTKAIEYGKQGIGLAEKIGFNAGAANSYLNTSTAYIFSDKLDTALLYLDTALGFAHVVGDKNRLGLAYLNRADIYRQLQNFNQSLKNCDTALKYADQANNDDVRARVNQTFGAVFYSQQLHQQGIPYYTTALELYRKTGNLRMSAAVLNNLGLMYKALKDYTIASRVTMEAIHITDSLKDITNLSIYNSNLGEIYSQMGNYAMAQHYAKISMEYAVMQHNDKLIANAWINEGNVLMKLKRYKEAIAVLEKAYVIFRDTEDINQLATTTDLLAEAYSLTGDYSKAYEYMALYRTANDSLVKWRYDDDIAAMQTKFKVIEKDKAIEILARDKELQQQKIARQHLIMVGSAVIGLLALGGIWLAINRYRLKQRMKELELRNQIAADLHDEVGSSLSSIHMLSQMAASQQSSNTQQQDILARMSSNAKETMDKMGDIVWMIKPNETEAGSLKQRIERFACEICSSKNVALDMQLNDLEKTKLSMEQRKNIFLIFKEALNNALKYSGTGSIEIKVITENKRLALQVTDHGKGFDIATTGRGNGLDNMRNRAKELHGELLINTVAAGGTTVKLKMPL